MMRKQILLCLLAAGVFLLSSCAGSDVGNTGMQYPPTDKVETLFQTSQAPASCRVFAHLFATMPANMLTSDFAASLEEEAKSKGADMLLVGHSRQCTTGSDLEFSYYGPDREYGIREWPGWSYGFEEWGEQGSWASIGYDEWTQSGVHYDFPVIMQVVFLRCQN